MLTSTEGIVLKTQKYSEADLIVTYLTLGKGIIKAFAKSSRKTKSRFGSSLEPFTHAKISLMGKEQSMPRITQSDIINSFHGLRENYQDYIHISKLFEILISFIPENIPTKKLFLFILQVLHSILSADQKQKHTLYIVSQIRLLAVLGYAPRLKGCGKCGMKALNFFPNSGTTLCRSCAAAQPEKNLPPIRITDNVIKFYSHCTGWSMIALTRLRPPHDIRSTLGRLLEEHINYLLNKRLLSSSFLASM